MRRGESWSRPRAGGGISARATAYVATMRARLALVGPAILLACAPAPGGAAQTVTPGATGSRAPGAAQGPSEPASAQAPSGAREPAEVPSEAAREPGQEAAPRVDAAAELLAEVQAMDPAARWAWAVSAMPALAEHREVGGASERWAEFRRLAAGRTRLWVRARGDRCFAVRGGWEDDGFFGRAREVAELAGAVKTVRFESVEITDRGISTSGPHGDEFSRDARGRWQKSGGFGVGSFATIADGPVFEVRRTAAYYGEGAYTLTIECSVTSAQEERCTDGTIRRCTRCTGLSALPHAPGRGWAGPRMTLRGTSDRQVDCSAPCPPDLLTPQLPALNWAVKGRAFVLAGEPDAAVYLDAGACRSDRRMR
ncbi:hypothetical protein SAMN02745121_06827 [Nannocystis exedens]|uniref:Uncharacterized protein n=1 Tax=Nannocystis exedens TaxID=54 RepID=A0A1I2FUF9_9BACT|nr:hypothetical protein [Nannocystis exedens]PCC73708.1 hypothetical protein NAEX_06796 [Nannocystis exedens]SFF08468.1 hypothetical protein SAMN02745121_06827 [Nannocystis exedens]